MASAAAVHRRGAEFPPADRLSEQKLTESQSARSVGPSIGRCLNPTVDRRKDEFVGRSPGGEQRLPPDAPRAHLRISSWTSAALTRKPRRVVARKRVDFIQGSWRGVERAGLQLELHHREVDEGAKAR